MKLQKKLNSLWFFSKNMLNADEVSESFWQNDISAGKRYYIRDFRATNKVKRIMFEVCSIMPPGNCPENRDCVVIPLSDTSQLEPPCSRGTGLNFLPWDHQ